jgi:hypothetical protein
LNIKNNNNNENPSQNIPMIKEDKNYDFSIGDKSINQ